jgi:hypothetical protein
VRLAEAEERGLAAIWTAGVAKGAPIADMLAAASELLGRSIGYNAFMRRVDLMAERGLVEPRTRSSRTYQWTEDMVAELTSKDIAGLSAAEAAALLKTRPAFAGAPVTPAAVKSKRYAMGLGAPAGAAEARRAQQNLRRRERTPLEPGDAEAAAGEAIAAASRIAKECKS